MLSMIFDIIVPRWPRGSGRGRSQHVPADGFYLLAVVINVAIVVLISGALAPARKGGPPSRETSPLICGHATARPGVRRRAPCLVRKAKPVSVGLQGRHHQ